MCRLILIASSLTKIIEDWNEKLNSFAAENLDSPWFGALALIVLFAFGCWGVSYFSKK